MATVPVDLTRTGLLCSINSPTPFPSKANSQAVPSLTVRKSDFSLSTGPGAQATASRFRGLPCSIHCHVGDRQATSAMPPSSVLMKSEPAVLSCDRLRTVPGKGDSRMCGG
eukprot:scaffold1471_cov413-Prasinococcus_capsulatus_cf.AAC.3